MNLFKYSNYRSFLEGWISRQPNRGRGQLRRIADRLRVHPTLVTRILRGTKQLTSEQAWELTGYLELGEREAEYFLSLVECERAGTRKLRERHQRRLAELRAQALPSPAAGGNHPLNDLDRAIYYSHWYYAALHVMTAIPRFQAPDGARQMAQALRLPPALVASVLEFLVAKGLCREQDGVFRIGIKDTRLEESSATIDRHLVNWRLKAVEQVMTQPAHPDEVFYSVPLALGTQAGNELKKQLRACIERAMEAPKQEPCEVVGCLNIDWFYLRS
jgi:uncharacterized protein (TIGR02147 family)